MTTTGDDLIAQAKHWYQGDGTATNLVSDTLWLEWLNTALREAWQRFPSTLLGSLASTITPSFTSGKATIAGTVRRIIAVNTGAGTVQAQRVDAQAIALIDANAYTQPYVPVYSYEPASRIMHIRPAATGTVTIVAVAEPTAITTTTAAVTSFPEWVLPAVTHLMASYAYGMEEDTDQATMHMKIAYSLLSPTEDTMPDIAKTYDDADSASDVSEGDGAS